MKNIFVFLLLLGFASGVVPEVVGYFRKKQNHKFELELYEAKAKYADQMSKLKIQELDSQAEIAETKGLYEHDRSIDAGGFVNGLRGSVRPVITYLFFLMFASVKGTMIYAMITNQNLDWTLAIETAWDSDTAAVFSAILAFWFGNRAMSKARAWQIEKRQLK